MTTMRVCLRFALACCLSRALSFTLFQHQRSRIRRPCRAILAHSNERRRGDRDDGTNLTSTTTATNHVVRVDGGAVTATPAATTRRQHLFASAIFASTLMASLVLKKEASAALNGEEQQRISIFEKVSPSVVFIDTFTERQDVFSTNVMEVPLGSGSGFVWDRAGHIVTNFHVVRNAQFAQVAILTPRGADVGSTAASSSLSPSSEATSPFTSMRPMSPAASGGIGVTSSAKRSVFKATVVGVDPSKDVAVLKVDAPKSLLYPIAVGKSSGLRVGQQSLAIGNPFGLDHTLTSGIISGTGRQVKSPTGRPINNVIQTDAAINPGNSGGPLLDSSGKLIGMNTAIYSPSGASAGIGFAIPIDTVKYIVETLIRDGQVIRPVLGISFLESRQARALGIGSGVLVLEVPEGSPAARAGLKGTRRTEAGLVEIGDIISKIGDQVINTESDLFQALEDKKPGDVVKLTVSRVTAAEEGLKIEQVVLDVPLQSSAEFEKKAQSSFQYRMEQ